MRRKIPLGEARGAFEQRREFDCNGTLKGYPGQPRSPYGRLPMEWRDFIRQFHHRIVYTVDSYETPIAWVMDDGRVIVPPRRYSQTTGRHVTALGLQYSEPVRRDDAA